MSGKVYLIGAGPGDPELLTFKAAKRIGEADVVLIDDLVDRGVLVHARPEAGVVEVGKRGGCRSTPQRFIERLMVRLAREGRVVARVKGGDPFVFGRGGEEVLALARAGVAFEVINGISAGIAGPAAAGIPVTHRGLSDGVTFVTGHTTDGREPDWTALVRSRTTLVVYMSVVALQRTVDGLLAAGMSAAMPVAAIERATCPGQRILRASLGEMVAVAVRAGLSSPAVLVVGEAVGLADRIAGTGAWIDEGAARCAA